MKKRIFVKIAGILLFFLAFTVEGLMIGRVQGSAPVSVLTVGNVSAVLTEWGNNGMEGRNGQAIVIEKPEPGQVFRCEPRICMSKESEQAYVRARILVSGVSEQQADRLLSGLKQSSDWNLNPQDGYYYYKTLVLPMQQIPVFEGIQIPEEWEHVDKVQVDVTVEVAEASRLTPVVDAECQIRKWIVSECGYCSDST